MRWWMTAHASSAAASTPLRWATTPLRRILTAAARFQPSAAQTLWLTTTGISLIRTTAPVFILAAPTRKGSTTTPRRASRDRASIPSSAAATQSPTIITPLLNGVATDFANTSDVPTRRGATTIPWPTSILACARRCSQVSSAPPSCPFAVSCAICVGPQAPLVARLAPAPP